MILEKRKSKPKQREKNWIWVIRDKLKIEKNKLGSK